MRVGVVCCSAAGTVASAKWIWCWAASPMPNWRTLTDADLTELERWLDVPDQQILAWVNGMEPVPPDFDTALSHRLRDIHGKGTA